MGTDETNDPILRRLAGLELVSPSAAVVRRVRMRCHAVLEAGKRARETRGLLEAPLARARRTSLDGLSHWWTRDRSRW